MPESHQMLNSYTTVAVEAISVHPSIKYRDLDLTCCFLSFFQGLLQCTAACLVWWGKVTGYGSHLITSLNCTSQPVRACISESGIFIVFFFLFLNLFQTFHVLFYASIPSWCIFSGLLFCPDTIFLAGITAAIHCIPIVMVWPRGWKALWWMIVSWHTSFFRLVFLTHISYQH